MEEINNFFSKQNLRMTLTIGKMTPKNNNKECKMRGERREEREKEKMNQIRY